MTRRSWWPKRAGIIFALSFLLVDMLFYGIFWLAGSSNYIHTSLELNLRINSFLASVWNIIHAPVNTIFGPLIFPYYRTDSNDLMSLWSVRIYLSLCFLQMFGIGFITGKVVEKILRRNEHRKHN